MMVSFTFTERSHQRDMMDLADRIILGVRAERSITLDCTPGGGKTGAATLLANKLLDAGLISKVLWVVPRLSLAQQVCDGFASGCGSRDRRTLEAADGQDPIFPPSLPNTQLVVGNVVTYQTIASKGNHRCFRAALESNRTLLILDEVQFLNDEDEGRGWFRKIKGVYEVAAYQLVMSGTLWRTDNKRIPFIRYEPQDDGKLYPLWDIQYSLRQAVAERAVLPTEWHTLGGRVEYNYDGKTQIHDLMDDGDEEESRKVRAFLSDQGTVNRLLDEMVADWRVWRERVYTSRMLVVAQNIREARRIADYLAKKHTVPCVLATSKDSDHERALRKFRERHEGQCLVTVAMAYVGFDCPDLSHMAYLSVARAPSWMLQCFARVSRFDRKAPVDYDHQHAFVFAPDDQRMRRFFDWLREETRVGVRERQRLPQQIREPAEAVRMPDDFEPISAKAGGMAVESLRGRIDPEREERVREFAQRCPSVAALSTSQLYEALQMAGYFNAYFAANGEES